MKQPITNGETMSGKETMPTKRNETAAAGNGATQSNGDGREAFEFRENPRVNAQIDEYIKQNPKRWAFIKSMSRERLERAHVWQQIRSSERQQKLTNGLLRRIDENPALKSAYDNLLQHVPEDQRERAKASIARTLVLSQSRAQKHGVAMAA
ncbi:MAG TPA: hypothetical protein VH280_16905 [Verrucomicrobiae bacterium]|jgi:hypothetical protein|nr:hypothetical protein [Verrucomicrobiae bacterium]